MTLTLLDRIKTRIDDAALTRLGHAIGVDGSAIPVVMSAALPGLLTTLTGAAHRPGGARALFADTLHQPASPSVGLPPDIAPQDERVERLGVLAGRATTDRLGRGLARFAGLEEDQATALLALLLPVVIDTLHACARDRQLDADGLARLLLEQRNAVDAAMPPGFIDQLKALGFFEVLVDDAPSTASTPIPAPPSTPSTPPGLGGFGGGRRKTHAWVLALLTLLLVALAGMRLSAERASDMPPRSTGSAVEASG